MASLLAVAAGPPTTTTFDRRERQAFTVSAVAPSTPALAWSLEVDPADRLPGNAATAYLQAQLLVPENAYDVCDQAADAHDAGRSLAGNAAVTRLMEASGPVFDLLDVAARRPSCDWGVPYRQMGIRSMLPYLNNMRTMALLVVVRGWQRADRGDLRGEADSARLLTAIGRQVAEDGPLVSGLVGDGILALRDERTLTDLIGRPGAPNLYWPLVNVARPGALMRTAMDGERAWFAAEVPVVVKARHGPITADDWAAVVRAVVEFQAVTASPPKPAPADVGGVQSFALAVSLAPAATAYYARTRHLTAGVVASVELNRVLATYVLEQYQAAADEQQKLLGLPYALALPRLAGLSASSNARLDPANPLVIGMVSSARAVEAFARVDRRVAALAAVEAVRAYAADHGGQLPAALADVTETPVPDNPVTGRPFEWRVADGVGTLGDHGPLLADRPLAYTVRVRRR